MTLGDDGRRLQKGSPSWEPRVALPSSPGAVRYRTIVADPPWPIRDTGPRTAPQCGGWDKGPHSMTGVRSVVPYDRLSVQDIAELPVAALAERDSHLYLWAVNAFLEDAYDVARAWGFTPSILLTWCKRPMGLGFGGTFVNTTEFVVFARRGSLSALQRCDTSWWQWPRGAHSQKPEHFLDMVEQVSPGPYVELFSRRHRMGWDVWGNESANTATLGPVA